MSPEVKDFYGKEVASAIKEACDTLGVAQENLDIEVVETGSKGIFGLISKKAHIKVTIQSGPDKDLEKQEKPIKRPGRKPKKEKAQLPVKEQTKPKTAPVPEVVVEPKQADEGNELNNDNGNGNNSRELVEYSLESLKNIQLELERILELMGCPSNVEVESVDGTAQCKVSSEYEDDLTSQDGRTLDSLQYLLRKIISRKIPERVRLSIDVGDYRERRHQQLREQALEYAAQVQENGKTQVIPSLNPSERRVVHVALQDDSEIRSRSVGDGLFKKVLIYKPSKNKKGNGRRRGKGQNQKKNTN
jgi:spoIIIJ-associated protein